MLRVSPRFFLLVFALITFQIETGFSDEATPATVEETASASGGGGISVNPAGADVVAGTGQVGRWLGFKENSGVFLGGLWIADTNDLIAGGETPGRWTWNSLFIARAGLDLEKLIGLKGTSFSAQFLQFNGQPTNKDAGSVQGYNNLPGVPPLARSELYQLWWRQELFDGKLIVRLGKMAPSNDFNNVLRPVPTQDPSLSIPSVSGLIYTPIFVNPTLLGLLPGYYNSACGVIVTAAPTKNFYFSYGFFDGNLANKVQTGMTGPHFNGYYFHIWEAGAVWQLGRLPGSFGAGVWHQTGELHGPPGVSQNGATGGYVFGSQLLWSRHPGKDNSGISGFFQFGVSNTQTLPANQYLGLGLTGFALVPGRPRDSAGVGMSWAWLNPNLFTRSSELMFQTYYQVHLVEDAYFQPALTYIPTPGASSDLKSAWAVTMRVILLF